MRKFLQLAEDVEKDLVELDKDADELNARRLQVKERARNAVNNHHRIQDRIEEGLAAMEKIAGAADPKSNSRTAQELADTTTKNSGEGSGDTSGQSKGGTA